MEKIHPLTLTGSPHQRGQTHGETLRLQISELLLEWKTGIEAETKIPFATYRERFLTETDFLPAIRQHTPHLLDEVSGIAEGASTDFESMFLLQCLDEEWWFREKLIKGQSPAHCSGIGVWGEGYPPLLAQNMDIYSFTAGRQVLLDIREDDRRALVFSFAGFIGLTGLSDQPIGVCCNTLSQLNTDASGMPVAFIVRAVLEQPNLAAAEAFLRRIKHASGQNYLIGDAGAIADFECSANAVTVYNQSVRRLFHTNHPLASGDLTPEGMTKSTAAILGSNTQIRLDLLKSQLSRQRTIGIEAIQFALCTSPVCVMNETPNSIFTSGSLVMELKTPPELHITFGPPAGQSYQHIVLG